MVAKQLSEKLGREIFLTDQQAKKQGEQQPSPPLLELRYLYSITRNQCKGSYYIVIISRNFWYHRKREGETTLNIRLVRVFTISEKETKATEAFIALAATPFPHAWPH